MIPVILSGGSGTRLWPVSRSFYPKQFCAFYDKSFLQSAISRLNNLSTPLVLTVNSMQGLTQRVLAENNIPMDNAIYEPYGKNTAPAIALICHILKTQGKANEVVGIFPADHLIADESKFLSLLSLAEKEAERGSVVTLGVSPSYASTGYGYIECQEGKQDVVNSVAAFHEKPNVATAESYLRGGRHFWNSGIFIFKVDSMIENFKEHLPEVWTSIVEIKEDLSNLKYQYANIQSVSIDIGVMEKIKNIKCIPADFGWSDVGSWDELARIEEENSSLRSDSNAIVVNHESQSNYVFSIKSKVVGLVGVERLIVIDTPDALLICKKGKSQDVKGLVESVKARGLKVSNEHLFEKRPWGSFEIVSDGDDFKTKTVCVDAGHQLSYQSHQKRDEHWVIVSGHAEVTLEDEVISLIKGEYIHIPRGSKHRIKNPGNEPLVFVEVQVGDYFGEDDIVRYQDDYNRMPGDMK